MSDDRVMCILHLRASKTLMPTAPDMNYVAVRLKLLADGRRAADWEEAEISGHHRFLGSSRTSHCLSLCI